MSSSPAPHSPTAHPSPAQTRLMQVQHAPNELDAASAAYYSRHSFAFPAHSHSSLAEWYDASQIAANPAFHAMPAVSPIGASAYDFAHHFNTTSHRGSIALSSHSSSSSPYHSASPVPTTPTSAEAPWSMMQPPYVAMPAAAGGNHYYRAQPVTHARQRTNQACEKCRDRKTKCTGERPTCQRCAIRGLVCEYASEHRVRGPAKNRKRSIASFDATVSPSRPASPGVPSPFRSKDDAQPSGAHESNGAVPPPQIISQESWGMPQYSTSLFGDWLDHPNSVLGVGGLKEIHEDGDSDSQPDDASAIPRTLPTTHTGNLFQQAAPFMRYSSSMPHIPGAYMQIQTQPAGAATAAPSTATSQVEASAFVWQGPQFNQQVGAVASSATSHLQVPGTPSRNPVPTLSSPFTYEPRPIMTTRAHVNLKPILTDLKSAASRAHPLSATTTTPSTVTVGSDANASLPTHTGYWFGLHPTKASLLPATQSSQGSTNDASAESQESMLADDFSVYGWSDDESTLAAVTNEVPATLSNGDARDRSQVVDPHQELVTPNTSAGPEQDQPTDSSQ